MVSLSYSDKLTYIYSQLERATVVCNLDAQVSVHPAYNTTHLEQDLEVLGSLADVIRYQFPAKFVSAYTSKYFLSSGLK